MIYYLYVRQYRVLAEAELNFDANHRYHFDADRRRLELTTTERRLPTHFFSTLTGTEKKGDVAQPSPYPVDSVSVIVGDNGAGKSSVAVLLSEIFSGRCKEDYVVVVDKGDGKPCYATSFASIETDLERIEFKEKSGLGISLCYHSPHFLPYRTILESGDIVGDLSSGGLVWKAGGVASYEDAETQRLFAFLSMLPPSDDWIRESFGIDDPLGLSMFLDSIASEAAKQWVDDAIGRNVGSDTEELRALREILRSEGFDLLSKMLVLLMAKAWKADYRPHVKGAPWIFRRHIDLCNELLKVKLPTDGDGRLPLAQRWGKIAEFLESADVRSIASALSCEATEAEKVMRVRGFLGALHSAVLQCHWQRIGDEENGKPGLATQFNPMVEINQEGVCTQLVKAHADLGPHSRLLRFGVTPALSAGERSSLALWSRLWEWLEAHPKARNGLVLFLDEAETTLHPSLQRKLVRNIILFFERFYPDAHVHVIFATHSPNLLSDLPTGNALFLRRQGRKGGFGGLPRSVVVDPLHYPDTFGGNVFDIYYRHFALNSGPVGEFATDKIRGLIKRSASAIRQQRKEDSQVAELIGDDYVRGYLRLQYGGKRAGD